MLKALLVASLLLVGGCSERKATMSPQGDQVLSNDEIINVAREHAVSLEIPLDAISIICDHGNERWSAFSARRAEDADPMVRRQWKRVARLLENREYQSVYLDGGVSLMGGPWWVLVDRRTGEVIITVTDVSEEGHSLDPQI